MKEFIGARLTQARNWRGYTIEYLAGMLAVTKASVSLYEKGSRQPSALIQTKLANVLDFPQTFFLKEFQGAASSPISFRKKSNTKKISKQRAEIYKEFACEFVEELEQFISFKDINHRFMQFLDCDPYAIDDDVIESLAVNVREHMGIGLAPIDNLCIFLENRGFLIFEYDGDISPVDGYSSLVKDRPYIFINKEFDWDRIRFTLAHELGHVIMHSILEEDEWLDGSNQKLFESQANRFAGAFLFPRQSFEIEFVSLNRYRLLQLKNRWGMSMAAIAYRAKDLDMVDQKKYEFFVQQMSREKMRIKEDGADLRAKENPFLIRTAIDAIKSNSLIELDLLRNQLALPDDVVAPLSKDRIISAHREKPKLPFKLIVS